MKIEEMTEPIAMLVNKNPRLAGSRCNSSRPTTGINAEIIEMKNENNALLTRMILIPGVYRTYRIAVMNDSKKLSSGRCDCGFSRYHKRMAAKTKRKAIPLNAKIEFAPISEIKIPPRAGPTMPLIFICSPPRLFAPGKSFAGNHFCDNR